MIKKILFYPALACIFNIYLVNAQSGNNTEQIDTGRIDRVMYRIVIPPKWNHNLVMFTHGYENPAMPSDPKRFHNPWMDRNVKPFLDRGFAVATVENFYEFYDGALPMCPLAGRPYLQIKMALDMNAVVTGWNDGVLRDVSNQAGGNPIDNTNTMYTGFPDDWGINTKVERIASKPGTEWFLKRYDRTGDINIPTVMIHTIYDPSIFPSLAINSFDNLAQEKGKQNNLAVFYTNKQGHCNFSAEETGRAFDIMRKWAASGKKPRSGTL